MLLSQKVFLARPSGVVRTMAFCSKGMEVWAWGSWWVKGTHGKFSHKPQASTALTRPQSASLVLAPSTAATTHSPPHPHRPAAVPHASRFPNNRGPAAD